jgi:single-strand DNA-binding protein
MYLNKAIIYGNLTRDPELKAIPSGSKVATFSVATNRVWKDKAGARQEAVDYHNVVVFGRQAETVSQYLKKGSGAMIEGRMQTRSWDGQDGQKKYRTEIVADRIQFGPRSGNAVPSVAAKSDGSAAEAPPSSDNPPTPTEAIEYPEEEINPDDIPF